MKTRKQCKRLAKPSCNPMHSIGKWHFFNRFASRLYATNYCNSILSL
uniref:Uncharacterized protein n=1 Tax=Heterorhabditis bacteriophora TaxID=37862 RepID=A0A1I7X216_HETBA